MPLSTPLMDRPLNGPSASSSLGWVHLLAEHTHHHMSVGAIRLDGPHTGCSAPVSPRSEEVSSEVSEVSVLAGC